MKKIIFFIMFVLAFFIRGQSSNILNHDENATCKVTGMLITSECPQLVAVITENSFTGLKVVEKGIEFTLRPCAFAVNHGNLTSAASVSGGLSGRSSFFYTNAAELTNAENFFINPLSSPVCLGNAESTEKPLGSVAVNGQLEGTRTLAGRINDPPCISSSFLMNMVMYSSQLTEVSDVEYNIIFPISDLNSMAEEVNPEGAATGTVT